MIYVFKGILYQRGFGELFFYFGDPTNILTIGLLYPKCFIHTAGLLFIFNKTFNRMMNRAWTVLITVVYCVSIDSKICISRKACSQSECRIHSLMFLDKHAMYVLRTLLTGEYFFEKNLFFPWDTEEKLNWL